MLFFAFLVLGLADRSFAESPSMTTGDTVLTAMVADGATRWSPAALTIKKGDSAQLTLKNTTEKEHGFSIDELGIAETIKPGETKMVSLKTAQGGSVRYYCPLHKAHVSGQLTIE